MEMVDIDGFKKYLKYNVVDVENVLIFALS